MADGLWGEPRWAGAAMVTPVTAQGRIDVGRLSALAQRLVDRGINGLVLFGTMGEGPSFSAAERLEATARMIEEGFAPERIVLGIGATAQSDMAWLARRSGELKLAAVLATPPFFFRDVSQEGVFRAYAGIAEAAGGEAPPLLLYHIPQVTGVRVEVATVSRLIEAFPQAVRGIKDSEGSLEHTRSLLAEVGSRTAVLVGAEPHIPEALRLGARGTICGMANVIPDVIARLVAGDPEALGPVEAVEAALDGVPVIPVVKAAVGERLSDPAWAACMPALMPARPDEAAPLARISTV